MKELTEGLFIGKWKSYKAFRSSGEVRQHSANWHQELNFDPTKLLTVSQLKNGVAQKLAQTLNWTISLKDKKHYLELKDNNIKLEVITINHTALVLQDFSTNEKLFFARPEAWEQYIKCSPASAL